MTFLSSRNTIATPGSFLNSTDSGAIAPILKHEKATDFRLTIEPDRFIFSWTAPANNLQIGYLLTAYSPEDLDEPVEFNIDGDKTQFIIDDVDTEEVFRVELRAKYGEHDFSDPVYLGPVYLDATEDSMTLNGSNIVAWKSLLNVPTLQQPIIENQPQWGQTIQGRSSVYFANLLQRMSIKQEFIPFPTGQLALKYPNYKATILIVFQCDYDVFNLVLWSSTKALYIRQLDSKLTLNFRNVEYTSQSAIGSLPHVAIMQTDGKTVDLMLNGNLVKQDATNGNHLQTDIQLGVKGFCKVAYCIVQNNLLSKDYRQSLEGFFAWSCGGYKSYIRKQLSPDHPYRFENPDDGNSIPVDQRSLEFAIDLSLPGSHLNVLSIALSPVAEYNCDLDFGDGHIYRITKYGDFNITHTYDVGGKYTIKMTGLYTGFDFGDVGLGDDQNRIKTIKGGDGFLMFMEKGFMNLKNLTSCTNLDLGQLLEAKMMFNGCEKLTMFDCDLSQCRVTDYSESFIGTALDQVSVDKILSDLDKANQHNGTINLNSPNIAVPSAVGITAKTNLIAKGWTVTTNSVFLALQVRKVNAHSVRLKWDVDAADRFVVQRSLNDGAWHDETEYDGSDRRAIVSGHESGHYKYRIAMVSNSQRSDWVESKAVMFK